MWGVRLKFFAKMFVFEKNIMLFEIFIFYVNCDVNELLSMFFLRLKELNDIIK